MNNTFKGTGVAIITPFRDDLSIDFKALETLVEYQITNGIDYLVVLGTTGETATLTADEKRAVVDMVIDVAAGRVPVVIGIGGNNTQAVVNDIKQQDFADIAGLLSVAPYYNKPNQEGLYEHYKAVAAASPVPVIIYNVPGRTGANINAGTLIRLYTDFDNIVAVKEACNQMPQIMELMRSKPEGFGVISGDDALALPITLLGGDGVISVVANAMPKQFSGMIKMALMGKIQEAKQMHYPLLPLIDQLFVDGNPAGIKAVLELKGMIKAKLRLPLTPATAQTYSRIRELLNGL